MLGSKYAWWRNTRERKGGGRITCNISIETIDSYTVPTIGHNVNNGWERLTYHGIPPIGRPTTHIRLNRGRLSNTLNQQKLAYRTLPMIFYVYIK